MGRRGLQVKAPARRHRACQLVGAGKCIGEILARFTVAEIKKKSVSNIKRWRSQGTFGQAYADWLALLLDPDDHKLISAMVGSSDRSKQLRQSLPYVGMLEPDIVMKVNEEVRA